MTEIIRVLRVLEYVGPRQVVEDTLRRGGVPANGEHTVTIHRGNPPASGTLRIASALIGTFGEIVQHIDEPMDADTPQS